MRYISSRSSEQCCPSGLFLFNERLLECLGRSTSGRVLSSLDQILGGIADFGANQCSVPLPKTTIGHFLERMDDGTNSRAILLESSILQTRTIA